MSYMPQKDASITMKVQTQFKVDIANLIAIMYETDLFDKWVPFCKSSKTVSVIFTGNRC